MGNRLTRILFLIDLVLLSSCTSNVEEIKQYCDTKELFVKEIVHKKEGYREIYSYYKNGNLMSIGNTLLNEKKCRYDYFGKLKIFYPDGFLKEELNVSNEGIALKPTKEEALKGFETKFDYVSFGAEDTLGNKYTTFRYFIKGVPLFYQDVVICLPDNQYMFADKLEPDIQIYRIVKKDTSYTVEIDESLYSYYVPISEEYMKSIGDGIYELKVGVFFKNLDGDSDLPSPHVLFTAIINSNEE